MRKFLDSTLKYGRILNLRYNSLKRVVVLVVVIQVITLYWFFHNHYALFDNNLFSTSTLTRFTPDQIEISASDSSKVLQKFLTARPSLLENSIYQNCLGFFEVANNTDYFKTLKSMSFHSEVYNRDFHDDVLRQVERKFRDSNRDPSQVNDETDVLPLMEKYKTDNSIIEEALGDLITRLRVYGKCFIENRIKFQADKYELNLFPYLSGELPTYQNWEGKTVDFPIYAKHKKPPYSFTFLQQLQDKYNGRGIVMSIGDKLVDETCQLVKVLRFLNNTLPIQFVHNNELTDESVTKLVNVARSSDIKGPKQDMWIVNVASCLATDYQQRFNGFNSKWMAVLFSSFEEMLLMDNDLVPFISPIKFFTDFENYNKTGTFFFRDRESFERTSKGSQKLIKQVLPSKLENYLFDIPHLDQTKLESNFNFFQYGAKHFMESGIVVINKRKNLKGLLTSINVQLTDPIAGPFYGDKEVFWLGQVLSGNDNLYFNTNPAGNIGEVEDASKYAKTIKSIQPAHVSPLDNHTLLWINSGLRNCKKDTSKDDFEKIYKDRENAKFTSTEDLKKYYDSLLDIQGVVIPPNSNRDWNNLIHEPSRGFHQVDNQGCGGYYWNAYSSVGTPNDPPELTKGSVILFSEDEKNFIKQVQEAWIG